MRTPEPPLPAGWLKCPTCSLKAEITALFAVQLVEPPITSNDAGELIDNPLAGQIAITGHMCPACQTPIWPE